MKKYIFAAALCFAAASTFAQTKIAIKGGYNYSTARVSVYEQAKPTGYNSGYGLGLLFKAPFDGYLHFSPYIMYNKRGFKYNQQSNPDSAYNSSLHYIDIVPALSIDFPTGKTSAFVVSAGFNLSVGIAGTEKLTANGVTTSKKIKFDVSSNYGLFDLGLNTSIGYHFDKFLVEAGYNLGLADINNQYDKDGRNMRNRMLSFSVGYYIR